MPTHLALQFTCVLHYIFITVIHINFNVVVKANYIVQMNYMYMYSLKDLCVLPGKFKSIYVHVRCIWTLISFTDGYEVSRTSSLKNS